MDSKVEENLPSNGSVTVIGSKYDDTYFIKERDKDASMMNVVKCGECGEKYCLQREES